MNRSASHPPADLNEDEALRLVLEGTAGETGQAFFHALIDALMRALRTHGAWVTEYLPEAGRLRAVAFRMGGQWMDGYEYDIAHTPCEPVVVEKRLIHYPDRVVDLFPRDDDIRRVNAVSYMGVPLLDGREQVIGHLAVLDTRPMPPEPRGYALMRIFAARAAAELRRVRAEEELRRREQKLAGLLEAAMDAVMELDAVGRITLMNPAAERLFGRVASDLEDSLFDALLSEASRAKLRGLMDQLNMAPGEVRALWIPGGLQAWGAAGEPFQAEATLSRHALDNEVFHTLILRNVEDRLAAERRIHHLEAETRYLRDEMRHLQHSGRIIGNSLPMRRVLAAVEQVAVTDASVLILGETGTGKELLARAIHDASRRRECPLVRVNCAALPATLIESELFGHEKGAFTGAAQRREGRFALAHEGTIFLDEIGELPLDLQAKLLRVLQDGEFEPLGSSRTQHVDVRVVAATNRDLQQTLAEGKFREDLYFRLNVFPIRLPPLRERQDDIPLLAESFLARFARQYGRAFEPLSEAALRRLRAYPWPGNVRELENVIERALIISPDGRLDFQQALPEMQPTSPSACAMAGLPRRVFPEPAEGGPEAPVVTEDMSIRTAAELLALEKENLHRALERCHWQVAGEHGAARLLGVPPSTLSSRMKALGIHRPQG